VIVTDIDTLFGGGLPKIYETYLVPLIFEPFAHDLVTRVASRPVDRVLEIAAGTGIVTRALASTLPEDVEIVATDLNQPMLVQAAERGTKRPVEWRKANAMELPFADDTFDAVVCQFGVMFFPDKPKAFAEARRVLKPGGRLLFNAWDRIDENEFADTVTTSLEAVFPADPPRFLARVPHGYADPRVIEGDMEAGGFARPELVTVQALSRAISSREPAVAYCLGTPLRNEIDARDPSLLRSCVDAATDAVSKRFGSGPVEGKIQAHVVTVGKEGRA
jgi:SAM-dependent methyltransferase